MKLYYFQPSTYSQKVLIACQEKRVSFEPVIVNLFEEEERERYREIYPTWASHSRWRIAPPHRH